MSYDNTCKYLAEKYPAEFVRWLLQTEPQKLRILKTELNLEPVHADSLLLLRMGRQILHLEFQTKPQSKPPLPLRVLDYSVRLKRIELSFNSEFCILNSAFCYTLCALGQK